VKVRIKRTPAEKEIDGITLTGMLPGTVRDVSPELGIWLIAEDYADAEMRRAPSAGDQFDSFFSAARSSSQPRERRFQKR
jgi:hypothetical protein